MKTLESSSFIVKSAIETLASAVDTLNSSVDMFESAVNNLKEVLRRENQGLKVYPVDGSSVFSMTGTYF